MQTLSSSGQDDQAWNRLSFGWEETSNSAQSDTVFFHGRWAFGVKAGGYAQFFMGISITMVRKELGGDFAKIV